MSMGKAHLILFAALLLVAACFDVILRRIPNWITVAIAASGFASVLVGGGVKAALAGVGAAVGTGLLFVPLWMRRAMGGGDLKLAAACAVWVGLSRSPFYLFASCLAGGALAIICYALSSAEGRRSVRANVYGLHAPSWPRAATSPGKPRLVPYGAAFAAGAIWTVLIR